MQTNKKTVARIKAQLEHCFSPDFIEVIDETHRHAKHANRESGKGNFKLSIKSKAFNNHNQLQRHQMIYRCLDHLMQTHIHALQIKIMTD